MARRGKMHLKKGDTVIVLRGRDAGKTGKLLSVNREKSRVVVEHINMVKRHMKPSAQYRQGGIIEKEAAIHASNVALHSPKLGRGDRVRIRILDDGKKVRVGVKSGEVLDD